MEQVLDEGRQVLTESRFSHFKLNLSGDFKVAFVFLESKNLWFYSKKMEIYDSLSKFRQLT